MRMRVRLIWSWSRRNAAVVVVLLGVLAPALALWGCSSGPGAQKGASPTETGAVSLPKIDGLIQPDEYEHHYRSEQVSMDLYWTIFQDRIYFGLRSAQVGWLAVGFDPQGPVMKGADIVFGYVKDGQLTLKDEYAPSLSGHTPDTELGGTDDLLQRAARETEGGTTIEWVRRLLTGDDYDRSITAGRHLVMFAFSDSDDPSGYHGQAGLRRAMAFLDFYRPEPER